MPTGLLAKTIEIVYDDDETLAEALSIESGKRPVTRWPRA
jgi:hypothetical protein